MRFIIVGLGSIGRRHLRNLTALGYHELVLCRTGKSTMPDDEFVSFQVESDLIKALEKWNPEAVVISNPTALHIEAAIPTAEAGCHLFIEKPISHTLDGLDILKTTMKRTGVRAFVGFQFRFHPGLQAVKRLLDDRSIDRPISARVHWGEYLPDWHPWEDYRYSYSARVDLGGGVVLTLCHPFDYLRWLFGEVEAVSGVVGTLGDLDLEVEDTAEITLRFKDGPLASVHLDYNQRPPSHELEIIGVNGTIRWDAIGGTLRWWSTKLNGWQVIEVPEGFERNTMFLDEMRHFTDVVAGNVDPICTLDDGIRALEIALLAKRSASERSGFISLDPAEFG